VAPIVKTSQGESLVRSLRKKLTERRQIANHRMEKKEADVLSSRPRRLVKTRRAKKKKFPEPDSKGRGRNVRPPSSTKKFITPIRTGK